MHKKGDKSNPSNYRGITVTPVILKLLEHILNERQNKTFLTTQSRLQKGFTAGSSSMGAALILTECINEAKDKKETLFVATLDVQKAFDVVNHELLLRKLYIDGIRGNDWLLVRDIYTDMLSSVKWEGHLSAPFVIHQGVRQGGVLSTSHYKRYNNPLLIQLENRYTGMVIGSIQIPHITVADDLALITNSKNEMQYMLDDTASFANQERYIIHPTKSGVLTYGTGSNQKYDFTMLDKAIKIEQQSTHLGIFRDTKMKVNIEERISLARKTAYALMGAGLHSGNGMVKPLCAYLWNTYIIPRLIYGLEVQKILKSDLESLERFQRKCLRQIQGLPDKTPNCITLSLLGVPPVETIIHKNILNLFVNVARTENSVEHEILERQLVMKKPDENTWCSTVRETLKLYELPNAYELFQSPPTKETWKSMLNSNMNCFINKKWEQDILNKTSLKYINSLTVTVGIPHHCWSSVRHNIQDNRRAELKVRVLTGTYILQANRSCFNQYAVDPTCKVCQAEPEDREHFIARCQPLEYVREPYRQRLKNVFMDRIPNMKLDSSLFTQLILDCSMVVNMYPCKEINPDFDIIELWSRELIYKLHNTRLRLLKNIENKTVGPRS
ncbi:MAG: reverse transcriptase family protein [Candidatus Thiodiazotropha endolucinida]|nr:reverse transcriptase family protein [Candidatus Thiodiazotropha endolucinida]